MDPDEALNKIRDLYEQLVASGEKSPGYELACAVNDLDLWLTQGGMLPAEWEHGSYSPGGLE
jgi:hypothetical protein